MGSAQAGDNPGLLNPTATATETDYAVGQAMNTVNAEKLGETGNEFNEMAFSIEKVTVTAKSRGFESRVLLRTRTRP